MGGERFNPNDVRPKWCVLISNNRKTIRLCLRYAHVVEKITFVWEIIMQGD